MRQFFPVPLVIAMLALVGCDGGSSSTTPIGGGLGAGCRGDADCVSDHGALFCQAPGESAGCGVCRTAERQCESDDGCGASQFCREYQDPCTVSFCSPAGLLSSVCTDDCSATSCGAGSHCADTGRCVPDSCATEGFSCVAPTLCQPGVGADGHGCLRPSCTDDGDCGAGNFCVEGRCHATPGVCAARAA